MDDKALWRAYQTALIEVHPPTSEPFRFRVSDTLSPELSFAVLTAWNAGSSRKTESMNRQANAELAQRIDLLAIPRWPAINAPETDWKEESFAVIGISLDSAVALADHFGQNASYFVERGVPYLVARRDGIVQRWR